MCVLCPVVEELRNMGFVTGMTGDGVNDAPALKRADIGIAVEGATDAAKAAADIVLVEPGLSVIIEVRVRRVWCACGGCWGCIGVVGSFVVVVHVWRPQCYPVGCVVLQPLTLHGLD